MAKIFGEGRAEFSDGADSEEGNVELNACDKGTFEFTRNQRNAVHLTKLFPFFYVTMFSPIV